jgi:hypothetical protein
MVAGECWGAVLAGNLGGQYPTQGVSQEKKTGHWDEFSNCVNSGISSMFNNYCLLWLSRWPIAMCRAHAVVRKSGRSTRIEDEAN